jgi:hypothetical protein
MRIYPIVALRSRLRHLSIICVIGTLNRRGGAEYQFLRAALGCVDSVSGAPDMGGMRNRLMLLMHGWSSEVERLREPRSCLLICFVYCCTYCTWAQSGCAIETIFIKVVTGLPRQPIILTFMPLSHFLVITSLLSYLASYARESYLFLLLAPCGTCGCFHGWQLSSTGRECYLHREPANWQRI